MFAARDEIAAADGVLFPETWQLGALVHGFRARVFPSPTSYEVGRDKIEMTRVFQAACPDHVPATVITTADAEGIERVADELGFPVVVKNPRSTRGLGVFLVQDRTELRRRAAEIGVLYAQEVLESDRTLRVVVVGDRTIGAYWRVGGDGFLHNVARGGTLVYDDVPQEALELVERLCRATGIDHAGFDLLPSRGRLWLLELNVRFGTEGLRHAGVSPGPAIYSWLRSRWGNGAPEDRLPRAS